MIRGPTRPPPAPWNRPAPLVIIVLGRLAMPEARCPACGESKSIAGTMPGPDSAEGRFVPANTGVLFNRTGVPMRCEPFRACMACGLVWATLDPVAIRAFIRAHGKELAGQWLDEIDHGPCRDLPDTEWGRRVGGSISELDALARAGTSALVRRFREIRGVTWDVALKEAGRWPQMTREEKLEFFGWVGKEKTPKDDLGELF